MEQINKVTPKEVEQLVEEGKNTIIVDVREDDEVAQGMIRTAKHIPLEKIPHSLDELDQTKDYIVVCRSGNRSMMAASFMDERGFNVSNMEGGMLDWEGEVVL
ncbi:rhodanese-like domain-containing protein [Lentibacillus juripiscarius]|uniref:Rhodanese-like domain-containing protein n=1 Tax=Lentibacillus juripiscarius TaxID=257446 RepID=A0ABW5V447_9BACI